MSQVIPMNLLTQSTQVRDFCAPLHHHPYITIDTEFMREKTYYPILCLVQVAAPGCAAIIDPMAKDIDLTPLFEILKDKNVVKVFHAARQDLEIFYRLTGEVPTPLFDTQIAAMACGHGDQIGYEPLVRLVTGQTVDKGSRFTDWSIRPLSDNQLTYALGDVTHLRNVYETLSSELMRDNREDWIKDEIAFLQSTDLYHIEPVDAWRRLKMRHTKTREFGVLIKLAQWREEEAQKRDIPRGRVLKDDALFELARAVPTSASQLARCRSIAKGFERSNLAEPLLKAIKEGSQLTPENLPQRDLPKEKKTVPPDVLDFLRVLLKKQCETHKVAPRLIASAADLEEIARDDNADVPALDGWRHEVFGRHALDLKNGKVALRLVNGTIDIFTAGSD